MQGFLSKQEKIVTLLFQNLKIEDSRQGTIESTKSKFQQPVEELTTVTDSMVNDINKLINFLRKGNLSKDVKYFQINHQQKSQQWHEERKIRLTGSMFKTYINARPATRLKMPFDNFHKETHQIHSQAINYGVKNQDVARDQYIKLNPNYIVKDATLTIRTQEPWIGSSPDSLVYDQNCRLIGGVQIKCPFSKKDITVEQAMKIPDFYLKETVNSEVKLDQKHEYYYQVQGQMLVLDLLWVDFVVRTQKNLKTVRIKRNQPFIDCMRKQLRQYYFEYYIWEVLKQYARSEYLKQGTKYWMTKQNVNKLLEKLSISL